MKKATFYLDDIEYNRVIIESGNLTKEEDIAIDFQCSGIFFKDKSQYDLTLEFRAFGDKTGIENSFVDLSLNATFIIREISSYKEIPPHFYDNSVAIVYPYIRAFLTSLIFQANLKRKFILPTMNLVGIGEELKSNTTLK